MSPQIDMLLEKINKFSEFKTMLSNSSEILLLAEHKAWSLLVKHVNREVFKKPLRFTPKRRLPLDMQQNRIEKEIAFSKPDMVTSIAMYHQKLFG